VTHNNGERREPVNSESGASDYTSNETILLASAVQRIATSIHFDIGQPMRNPLNGDSMWYVLTNNVGDIYVIIITPHAIFSEFIFDDDGEVAASYSIISSISIYLEHLLNSDVRKLDKDELKFFLSAGDGTI